jgi:hypothetical protein
VIFIRREPQKSFEIMGAPHALSNASDTVS